MQLIDQLALVTGGGRGIGAAIAYAFADAGAEVIVADIQQELADRTARQLRETGHKSHGYKLDVTDRLSVDELASTVLNAHGAISILVNNAVIGINAAVDQADAPRIWDDTIAVNLTGVFNVSRAFLPALRQTKGNIVNISSVVAFTSGFADAGYVASKGGVRSLTQKMCRDFAPDGIRVNAVAPGYIETAMGDSSDSKTVEWLAWHCPMRRFGQPHEIGGPVVFLASRAASFVNGVTLPVDGGYLVI